MFNFEEVQIGQIIVHAVGNKNNKDGVHHAKQVLTLDEMLRQLLKTYFLSAFKQPQYFQFVSDTELHDNSVYGIAKELFADQSRFFELSCKMANQLYESSDHPNIKAGEFYMAMFKDCMVNGELCNAIGIFKSENKDTFLKVQSQAGSFALSQERGVNIKKLDKGCLIFDLDAETGYRVLTIDNLGKGQNALYWNGQFLQMEAIDDDYFQTQNYLRLTKGFVDEVYNTANEVERADQIDMLNRSLDYFKDNEHFDKAEFDKNVMTEEPIIEAFNDFKNQYQQDHETNIREHFPISSQAVKKEKGKLRSILKLDKNFHVYIHGQRDKVERGWDEKRGMHYYKLYFFDEI